MGYAVILLFIITGLLAVYEKYLGRYKVPIYIILGLTLILMAGLREVGIDPDSENYEYNYQNYYSLSAETSVEFSYLLFSSILNKISSDVHVIFLLYAFLGVTLKFIAFRRLSELWFLPVMVYISYYYEVHEFTQIRTGVMAAIFLLTIPAMAENRKMKAFGLIILAAFFHISAVVLLPLLFLSNKEMSTRQRILWAMIVPVGYAVYLTGYAVAMAVEIPYIGDKLALYQTVTEKGMTDISVNVFSPLFLFTNLIYFYLLYFYHTIAEKNKYFPLMLKIFGISILSYMVFTFLPVLSQRLNLLYRVVSIILYANIIYTIKPRWISMVIALLLSLLYLNYALPFIGFTLFWEV